jgi:two-component system sporulation sensor kinase B
LKTTVGGLAKEVSRLNGLVGDLRNLHRREKYQFDPTSLAALAKEVVDAETAKYDSKGIRVEVKFESGLPLVLVDRGKFKQALFNLCKNAEEAMPEGGTLTLRGYQSESKVFLEVRDTGCGLPKNLDLSEPFTSTKLTGTGLGLMIVRQIMSLHHGSISHSSEPGKGASFFLELPAHAHS